MKVKAKWFLACMIILMWSLGSVAASDLEVTLTAYEEVGLETTFVEGITHPGAIVSIRGTADFYQQMLANDQGEFAFYDLPLELGENRFEITAQLEGNEVKKPLWVRAGAPPRINGTGFLSLELGTKSVKGDPFNLDYWQEGLYTNFDSQLFLEGALANNYEVTLAHDSEPKEDLEEGFSYPTVGDESSIEKLVESSSPLYAKLEKDESYLLWGDYRTEYLGSGEFISYDRLLTGGRLHYESPGMRLDLGHSLTERGSQTDMLPGKGISGFYYLTQAPVVEYSEQVSIVTMDQDEPWKVVDTRPLVRNIDYEINYDLGTIAFNQPVPIQDTFGNPVYLSVTYEFSSGTMHSVTGGSFVLDREQVSLKLTAVSEGDYTVAGSTLLVTPVEEHSFRAETAYSSDDDKQGGAWLIGWDGQVRNVDVSLSYKSKGSWFAAKPGSAMGISEKRAEATIDWQPHPWGLAFSITHGLDEGENLDRESLRWKLEGQRELDKLTLLTRVAQNIEALDGGLPTTESLAWAGAKYELNERTSLSAGREEVLDDGTRGNGKWDFSLTQQLTSGVNGTLAFWRADDGENSTILSLESVVENGENGTTKFTTSSELNQSDEGWQFGTAHGLKSTLALTPNFGVDLHLSRRTLPGTQPLNTAALGWQYIFSDLLHTLDGKLEHTSGPESDNNLIRLAFSGGNKQGLSYKAEYQLTKNQTSSDEPRKLETSLISAAYRPVDQDRYSALLLWRLDRGNPKGVFGLENQSVVTLATEGAAWLSKNLEVAAKLGLRSMEESVSLLPTSGSLTILRQLRAGYRLAPRWDAVGSVRLISQDTSNSLRSSWAQGVSYYLTEDGSVKAEVGYRSDGYEEWADDPSRAVKGSIGGPYVRLVFGF